MRSQMSMEIKTTKAKAILSAPVGKRAPRRRTRLAARFLRMINSLKEIDPVFESLDVRHESAPRNSKRSAGRYAERNRRESGEGRLGRDRAVEWLLFRRIYPWHLAASLLRLSCNAGSVLERRFRIV